MRASVRRISDWKEHDDGQADIGNDEGKQRAQRLQAGPTGQGVDRNHGQDADQDVPGARPADHHQRLIHHEGDQQNVERPGQIQGGQRRNETRQVRHQRSCDHLNPADRAGRHTGTPSAYQVLRIQ
jgi:hypothetical protein